jgi:DNA repair protein RadC
MPAVAYRLEPGYGTLTIKEWPATDRPRERLRTLGPQSLSSRELLALLIGTGMPGTGERPARSAVDVAGDLLAWALQADDGAGAEAPRDRRDRQPLRRIMNAPFSQLCSVPGIGPAKAAKILAALDLGRRAMQEVKRDVHRFSCARDVFEHLHVRMRDLQHEEVHVLLLNAQSELLRTEKVAQGTLDRCEVHPRDVFGPAVREGAHGVVVVHNHPSGEPTASPEDHRLTAQLHAASGVVGVPLLDHIIIGEGRYWSFAEEKQLASGW